MLQNGKVCVYWSEMNKRFLTSAYERMRAMLVAKAAGIVSSDDDARDVIQEAFYKLWNHPQAIERQSQADALLTVTVRNLSIDTVRRRNAHPTDGLDENRNLADNDQEVEEQRTAIYRHVEQIASQALSERDREILFRRDRDEWSFEEIAEQFGTTPANVRVIVARARKTIRNLYRQQ